MIFFLPRSPLWFRLPATNLQNMLQQPGVYVASAFCSICPHIQTELSITHTHDHDQLILDTQTQQSVLETQTKHTEVSLWKKKNLEGNDNF